MVAVVFGYPFCCVQGFCGSLPEVRELNLGFGTPAVAAEFPHDAPLCDPGCQKHVNSLRGARFRALGLGFRVQYAKLAKGLQVCTFAT